MPALRRAVPEDAATLAGLRLGFWLGQREMGLIDRRDLSGEALLAETAKLITRPRTALLLASEEDGTISGYVYATVQVAPHLDPPLVKTIEEIFVLPGGTRHGVGKALAGAAFAEVADAPDAREQVRAISGNEAGRAFWERLGFSTQVLIMERGGC